MWIAKVNLLQGKSLLILGAILKPTKAKTIYTDGILNFSKFTIPLITLNLTLTKSNLITNADKTDKNLKTNLSLT